MRSDIHALLARFISAPTRFIRVARGVVFSAVVLGMACACCFPFGDDEEVPAATAVHAALVEEYDSAYIATHLARVAASPECAGTNSVSLAVFCPAARGWATAGTRVPLTGPPPTRAGVTTWVPTEGSVEGVDRTQRRFSILVLAEGGTQADITSPGSQDPATRAATESVSRNLLGQNPTVTLSSQLAMFLAMGPTRPLESVAPTLGGWQIQGGSFADLRRVGTSWVAVEVPRNNPRGLYLSVFTDAPVE